jgi:hypothetical protein
MSGRRLVLRFAQHAHQRFAEVAAAAGYQDSHVVPSVFAWMRENRMMQ